MISHFNIKLFQNSSFNKHKTVQKSASAKQYCVYIAHNNIECYEISKQLRVNLFLKVNLKCQNLLL